MERRHDEGLIVRTRHEWTTRSMRLTMAPVGGDELGVTPRSDGKSEWASLANESADSQRAVTDDGR
jgi:hypothetical protein